MGGRPPPLVNLHNWLENGPFEVSKTYFLHEKMGIFQPAMLVFDGSST